MNLVEPAPRVLTKEENPSLAKRNRRMFGALLGTLQVTFISYRLPVLNSCLYCILFFPVHLVGSNIWESLNVYRFLPCLSVWCLYVYMTSWFHFLDEDVHESSNWTFFLYGRDLQLRMCNGHHQMHLPEDLRCWRGYAALVSLDYLQGA